MQCVWPGPRHASVGLQFCLLLCWRTKAIDASVGHAMRLARSKARLSGIAILFVVVLQDEVHQCVGRRAMRLARSMAHLSRGSMQQRACPQWLAALLKIINPRVQSIGWNIVLPPT
eukprot:1155122-Pelagomonas_calceolata.AAC.1